MTQNSERSRERLFMKPSTLAKFLSTLVMAVSPLIAVSEPWFKQGYYQEPPQPLERFAPHISDLISSPETSSPSTINLTVASKYVPIHPCRIFDTRISTGKIGAPGGETLPIWAWAPTFASFGGSNTSCEIPPNSTTSVHVNVTIVAPTSDGFGRVFAVGTQEPQATVLAWSAGFGAANALTIPTCTASTSSDPATDCLVGVDIHEFYIKLYAVKPVHAVIDMLGYYVPLADSQ